MKDITHGRRWRYTIVATLLAIASQALPLMGLAQGFFSLSALVVVGLCVLAFAVAGHWAGRKVDRLLQSALTDVGTGLPNRRYTLKRLDQEKHRAQRSGAPLSILMIDLDDLKSINDTLGHSHGDTALRVVAQALQATVRRSDIAGRISGDEFAVIAPDTSPREATFLAERLRESVIQCGTAFAEILGRQLTVSVGIATLCETDGSAKDLLDAADRQLYRAKRGGRNCVASKNRRFPRRHRQTAKLPISA